MRLLELKTPGGFSLTKNMVDNIPPYAILSHTWGADTDEVTFRDLMDDTGRSKAGYGKIRLCEEQIILLGGHVLHRQIKQHRALRGHQLYVSLVL